MATIRKCLLFVISVSVIFCMYSFAFAKSKGAKVYVQTKFQSYDYKDDSEFSIKYSYNKKGLLKRSVKEGDYGQWKIKYTYKYNKRRQIKKQTSKSSDILFTYPKEHVKYKYNKNGYLIRLTAYNSKGKKKYIQKYKRNKNNKCVVFSECDSKGKAKTVYKHTLDPKTNIKKMTKIYKNDKLTEQIEFVIENKRKAIGYRYNSKGTLIGKYISYYKDKRLIKFESYKKSYDDWDIITVEKYYYKSIKVPSVNKVKKQQLTISDFAIN